MKSINTPFWILTILVFVALLLPKMIQEGLFKKFPVPDYALAYHVSSNLPAGTIGYCYDVRYTYLAMSK